MISYSDLHGRRVLTVDDARRMGTVGQILVDPRTASVTAIQLDGATGPSMLRWADVRSFGPDAVMVQSPDALVDLGDDVSSDLRSGRHQLLGKSVYSTDGDLLGQFEDLELDPDSARVTGLTVDGRELSVEALIVGPAAVIVRGG